MKRKLISVILLFFFCSIPAHTADKKWTVMVYMAADNDLESAGIGDFLEMSAVGSDENISIVVQFDRHPAYDNRYGNWSICHRFYIEKGMEPYESSAIQNWGDGKGGRELNTGAPETLADFVRWGVETYPAESYAVILWNHGGGWRALANSFVEKQRPPYKEVCYDDTYGDVLTMKQVRQALEGAGYYIDLIGFDACFMGMIEVATEIKNLGSVMVASSHTEPYRGWDYTGFLTDLQNFPGKSPFELASSIVSRYSGYGPPFGETLSAVDLAKVSAFNDALDGLLDELIILDNQWFNIYRARQSSQSFGLPVFIDFLHFLQNLQRQVSNPSLKTLLTDVIDAFNFLVIANHAAEGYYSHGLSVYLPEHGGPVDAEYNGDVILFPGETLWKDFINVFVAADIFSGYTLLFDEDFSGGLPDEWTVVDGYNDGNKWFAGTRPGIHSSYLTSPYMIVDSDAAGHVPMDEQLITSVIDFSNYSEVYLKFNHLFWHWSGNEKADVDIKAGLDEWVNIARFQGADAEGTVFINITDWAAGRSEVQIRWRYHNAFYDWFWLIDGVELWGIASVFPLQGDINDDGIVDIADVILCLRMTVGLTVTIGGVEYTSPYPGWLLDRADMNSDGTVDISDVMMTMMCAIGLCP